jgi:hypothetical protein
MARVKVSLSLDHLLVREVDEYLATHEGSDRSKVVDAALTLWSAAQQRAAMELQFADDGEAGREDYEAWRRIRREAARTSLRRT